MSGANRFAWIVTAVAGLCLIGNPALAAKQIMLTLQTAHIRASVRVKPGVYTLADAGKGAVQIEADGVTVDFQGATLQSPATPGGRQEMYEGVGISVNGHRNVTIRNAVVHGYQYNVKALKCSGLKLLDCALGWSRSQKVMDGGSVNYIWLVIRDLNAWKSYGAGAWLEDCTGSTVEGMRANQCQNGLMLVNSNRNRVIGCDFSYESGWGLAMWNSSDNLICWNQADFVNRPWGGGWGGDSSGFVLCSGSNRNVIAYNSFTHGGDGYFLATRDGGFNAQGKWFTQGSCDNNVVAYNDGSWSPHNAFESTLASGNKYYHNWANESDYGFWLGYSVNNVIRDNQIVGSRNDGIATEHGADNWYVNNVIERTGGAAIHLWGGGGERYAQTPSTRNHIIGNTITKARSAFDLTNSPGNSASGNVVRTAPIPAGFKLPSGPNAPADYRIARMLEIMAVKPKGFALYRDTNGPKGWDWLAATEYGMRDYRGMAVPWMMQDAKTLRLLVSPKLVKKIALPDWMTMKPGMAPNERFATIKVGVRATGEYRPFKIQVTGKRGERQTIQGKLLDADWQVKWFKWFRNDPDAYTDTAAWEALFAGKPLKEEVLPALPNIPGYGSPGPGLPSAYFALVATTHIKFEAGKYRFDTLSDDGIRVLVDGKPVVDNWTHHGGMNDSGTVALSAGVHSIEVRYCQENGASALSVNWRRSDGS
ncbi:MAG TPA: NosD domain-containing protein [Armatimonadota bacterium]|jgi:parallel beta-helix repeat protein